MTRIKSLLLTLLVIVSVVPGSSHALSPEELVNSMVSEMSKTGTPAVIFKYVDWNSAFEAFPAKEKEAFGISSPQDLKQHLSKIFDDPKGFIKSMMAKQLANMPPEARAQADQMTARMVQAFERQQMVMKTKLKNTTFKVGEAEINGDTASVPITSTREGETKNNTVKLVKIGGEWKLPTIGMLEDHGASTGGKRASSGNVAQ